MTSFLSRMLSLLRRIRTDECFPNPDWAFGNLEYDLSDPHPVSGLPLHFGSRGCPSPVTRLRCLHADADGARFEWTRDRVDPVFHVPNRHVCRFFVAGFLAPAPFSPEAADTVERLPPAIVERLENALLQDSELGFLQCIDATCGFTVERITRGMIGPLWSAACAPAPVAAILYGDPTAAWLHLPLDCTLHEAGPSIADDPLAPLYGDHTALAEPVARLRAKLPYRVIRQRRAYGSGTKQSQDALRELFPGLTLIPVDTGET